MSTKKRSDEGRDPRPIACLYSRVSNPNDKKEASIESQEAAALEMAEREGFRVPVEFRFRERYTGMESIHDRPILSRIRDMAAAGEVAAVVCYNTDRLARDPQELTTVVRGLHRDKVKPLFCLMTQDTSGRMGEAVLWMSGFASAIEWDQIRERSMRGRQKIYDRGQWVGPGRVRYGFAGDKASRTRSAHADHAPIVQRIFREVAEGETPRDISARLNLEGIAPPFRRKWTEPIIRDMIRDVTYKGVVVARKTRPTEFKRSNGTKRQAARPEDEHIPLHDARTDTLVSPELWAAANAAMSARIVRRGPPSRSGDEFLLAGFLRCGREGCGCRMGCERSRRVNRPGVTRQYRCTGNKVGRAKPNGCVRQLGAKWLEADAWAKVEKLLLEPGYLEGKLAHLASVKQGDMIRRDLKSATARRKTIGREVARLVDVEAGTESRLLKGALREKLAGLDREAESLDAHITGLENRLAQFGNAARTVAAFLERLEDLRATVREGGLPLDKQRKVLEALGAEVYAWPGGCRVEIGVPCNRSSNSLTTRDNARDTLGTIVVA
jgi:DNA invertase Pin-like site-specific DNA recombinase